MAINKTTQYTTNPNSIPVDTNSGLDQTLQDSLNERVINIDSVAESFFGLSGVDGQTYQVISWHSEGVSQGVSSGGGEFVFRSGVAKSEHNGGTVISPTVPPLSSQANISDFLEGAGESDSGGTGCFIRRSSSINAHMFGAYGDGASDDTAQIQKAINEVGEVNFIESVYILSSPLISPESSLINIVGSGPATKLVNNSTDMFTVDRPCYSKFENITLETGASAGHVWSFTTLTPGAGGYSGITNSVFKDIRVIVKNPAKSVMNNVNVNATFIDNLWMNFNVVLTQGHTVPAFDFQITSGGNVGANRWSRGRITYGDDYAFQLTSSDSGGYIYDNFLEDINFEIVVGGMVKVLGGNGTTLNNLYWYDLQNDKDSIGHGIYLGDNGGVVTRFTNISNCHRRSSNLGVGFYDIFCEPGNDVVGLNITNCNNATANGYKIQLNSSPDVVIEGLRENTVVDGISQNTIILSTLNFYAMLRLGNTKVATSTAIPDNTSHPSTGGELVLYPNTHGAGSSIWVRESGYGFVPVQTGIFRSISELSDIANPINTEGKSPGKMVFEFTNNRPTWAVGGSAASAWVYADGTTAASPT